VAKTSQMSHTGITDLRAAQVEIFKLIQAAQAGNAGITDLIVFGVDAKIKPPEVGEAADVDQAQVADAGIAEI